MEALRGVERLLQDPDIVGMVGTFYSSHAEFLAEGKMVVSLLS